MKRLIFSPPCLTFGCLLAGLAPVPSHAQDAAAEGAAHVPGPVMSSWSFEEAAAETVFDAAAKRQDPLFGNPGYVPGVRGRALKLDGFRTYMRREQHQSTSPTGAFTVESWVALASYPWSWAPIVDCSQPEIRGFALEIGPQGRLGFQIAAGSTWHRTSTTSRIPLRQWTHVAAVFEPEKRLTLYLNGEESASLAIDGRYVAPRSGPLTLGRSNQPRTWREAQLTTEDALFFLDGLLDEVRISGRARTAAEIRGECAAAGDLPPPQLSRRDRLPTGPAGHGSFGAFYDKLDYYPEWDDLWRVSEVPDVFVRFDNSPVQLVFWRGTSFVPCWVTENGLWYTNEWLETWGRDVASCAEPIMDRECRYSHVRIIEQNDARAVVHWRYALNDTFYTIAAVGDDGRGEWCDEFHIIYPDQVGVRKMELHQSQPARRHDWVEQIVVLPPGMTPDDAIKGPAISLVNMRGEVAAYTWNEELEIDMPEPQGANISYVHLQADHRPFLILPPDPVDTVEGKWDSPYFRTYGSNMAVGYRPDPPPSVYGWWNHWPVAQIPGDGRWVVTPDRPSHFNLTTFVQWKDHEHTPRKRTRIMLQGMTRQQPADLVPLARSWLQAPAMTILSGSVRGGRYDPAERAYQLEAETPDASSPLELAVAASPDSPLLNPAFIVRNWGNRPALLTLDGQARPRGPDFRQGIRRGARGDDLILWIRLQADRPVKLTLAPGPTA